MHTQEWHDARRKGIGGSDWYNLGANDNGCSRKLWYEKTGAEPDHITPPTGPMIRGTKMEHLVANEYAEQTGFGVKNKTRFRKRSIPEWWIGNIDRAIIGDAYLEYKTPGVLECKTVNQWRLRQILKDGLPDEWVYQVHHYLNLTGWEWGEIAILEPSNWEFHTRVVELDKNLIEHMEWTGNRFWDQVIELDPPEKLPAGSKQCQKCDYRDTCHGAALYSAELEPDDDEIEDDNSDELSALVASRVELDAIAKEAGSELEIVNNKIKSYLSAPKRVRNGGYRISYGVSEQSRIDTARLKEEDPETAKKYTKVIQGQSLRIKKERT